MLQRANLILARLDELVDIELAMLESLGRGLGGQRAGIAHFGARIESRTFVGVWFGRRGLLRRIFALLALLACRRRWAFGWHVRRFVLELPMEATFRM